MNWHDSRTTYGPVSRLNHWLGALLILVLLGIGLYFEDMPRGDEKTYWLRLHIALGAIALIPLAFRVFWRVATGAPEPVVQSPVSRRTMAIVHRLLLLAIVVLVATGPFVVWSNGFPIRVFDWFAIPSPLPKLPALHEALETIHAISAKVLLITLILHVLGALKHALIDRDGSLARMVVAGKALVPDRGRSRATY